MTNGLGAGFFAASLLAVLAALAVVVVVAGAVGLVVGDDRGRVDPLFGAVAVAVLAVALAVAGFGVAAMLDESFAIAVLVAGVTGFPVAVAAAYARSGAATGSRDDDDRPRQRDGAVPGWRAVAAVAALAWPLPFLAAVVVLWALTVATGVPAAVAGAAAVVVATGGAWVATPPASGLVAPATPT